MAIISRHGDSNHRRSFIKHKKSLFYSFRDRRINKRNYNSLFIKSISSMCKKHGLDRTYSTSIAHFRKIGCIIDKKTFFEIAKFDATTYHRLIHFLDKSTFSILHRV